MRYEGAGSFSRIHRIKSIPPQGGQAGGKCSIQRLLQGTAREVEPQLIADDQQSSSDGLCVVCVPGTCNVASRNKCAASVWPRSARGTNPAEAVAAEAHA